jgi:hypothetical protein
LLVWLLDFGQRVVEGGVKCSCSGFGAVLDDERKVAGKRNYFNSRARRRHVSLDGNRVDLGGCWSPGSSPGMIARENRPASSLAVCAEAAEGAAGSSPERGGAGSIKRAIIIFSVVFDVED